jgi:CheY-like chemotaxis protein
VIGTAGSGAEALKQARASCPDLVLMDIGLPGEMNGLEAGACIWEELKIPIVYVTAYADELTVIRVRTPQPVLAIRKPFDVSQLRSTLEQALTAPR